MKMRHAFLSTPIGPLLLVTNGRALTRIAFDPPRPTELTDIGEPEESDPLLQRACMQLEEYFDGRRTDFDLPLEPSGTPFQLRVWQALREIPCGETRSYGAIAARIGRPSASRAVGMANGRNPLPVVVPCHRVIGANGSLTGFGGGLPRKEALLSLERPRPEETPSRREETPLPLFGTK